MSRFVSRSRPTGSPIPAKQSARAGEDGARWHALVKNAAALAHAAGDVDDAIEWALDLVQDYSGWPLGHAMLLDRGSQLLASSGIWHTADADRFAPFIDASRTLRLEIGVGLPGRIIATGDPTWILDVAGDPNFARADAATACGICSAAGVPIQTRHGVVGVLEFFAVAPQPQDDVLLDFAAHVAAQLGGVIERQREVQEREHAEQALRRSEEHLAEAQRLAHIGSWSWDVGCDHVMWSAELHRIYGLGDESGPVSFDEYLSRVHPEDREKVSTAVRGAVESLTPYEHEYRIVWPSGEVRWVHAAGAVTARTGDVAVRLGGFCHDITEQRQADVRRQQAQQELARHQQLLERVARGEPVMLTLDALCRDVEARYPDARCTVLTVSAGEDVLRHAAAPSMPTAFCVAIDGLAIGEGMGACGTAAVRGEDVVVEDTLSDELTAGFVELANRHELRSVWSHPLVSGTGQLLGTFAVYRNAVHRPDPTEVGVVSAAGSIAAVAIERSQTERALTAAARLDPLTGLANRTSFLAALAYQLSLPDALVAVLFLDLDGFKWINDSLGHPAGDKILVEVAWRFEAALDGLHMLARFGGDEFTGMVVGAGDDELSTIARKLTTALEAPFVIDGGEFFLSVSIGIATNEFREASLDLVRDADAAMYAAKSRGRARHAVFDSALREKALQRVRTETELRHAVARDEFVMHYQPIIRLADGQRTSVEALVRWQHPTRGLVSPLHFIPLAEENGLITTLGQRVLDRVLSETVLMASSEDVNVAVNVSVVQLSDPGFAETVAETVARHGFRLDRLFIEVTETAVMQEIADARSSLQRLVDLGVRVLIDDFGTGYSSIARLSELPVSGVKIDRQFSALLGNDDDADRVFAAINGIANAMRLDVVAEGIENAQAARRARELGCTFGQGFHLGLPVPLADLS